jgi:hypothetical protein
VQRDVCICAHQQLRRARAWCAHSRGRARGDAHTWLRGPARVGCGRAHHIPLRVSNNYN